MMWLKMSSFQKGTIIDLSGLGLNQIEEMEKSGEIFVIRPSRDPQIGRMEKNPEKVKAVYDLGYKDACAQMEALKAWL